MLSQLYIKQDEECLVPLQNARKWVEATRCSWFINHLLQSWPKISGQIPTRNTSPVCPHAVLSSCIVYVQLISVAFNIALGGLPKIRNYSTAKLMTTGYRYPEQKCTLETPFSYLSQKILARFVGICKLDEIFFQVFDITFQTINNSWRNTKQ